MCAYGHNYETTWLSLKNLAANFCKTCRIIQNDIKQAAIKRHVSEQELVKFAADIGWIHIRKVLTRGLIEWQCPKKHLVQKVLRELKRGFCAECKLISDKTSL